MKSTATSLDKFYTKPSICTLLMKRLNYIYPINSFDIVIENCIGNGDIFNEILDYTDKVIGFDIQPDIIHSNIIQADFLNVNPDDFNGYGKKLLISNPPYSRNILYKFIKHSCKIADVICLILPKSFKNKRNFNTIPFNFHLVDEIDLPSDSFYYQDKEYDMNTVCLILEKREYPRQNLQKIVSKYFNFSKYPNDDTLAIRRVGVNASRISDNVLATNPNTFYYILLNPELDKEKFITEYNKIDFQDDISNGIGAKTLSKYKLIDRTNKISSKKISL